MASSPQNIELCLASPVLYPARGGAEIRFLNYLPGLTQRGINITVFSGTPKAKKLTGHDRAQDWYHNPPGSILPTISLNGAAVHRVRLPDKSGWHRVATFNQALIRHCRDKGRKPNVVQLIEPLSPMAVPWLVSLKSLGIARIFGFTLPYELPTHKLKRFWGQCALRMLYRQLDCVVTGSAVTKNITRELGFKTRIEVIPNGVNLQRFFPAAVESKKSLRSSLGLGHVNKMLVTVGSIIPRKGIDLLLETWTHLASRYPELHLVLVGARTDLADPKLSAFHRRLDELVSASGARDRVHFTGRVENVEAYLRASDMFIFASEREGMANVVLEAMASGLPVVMTPHIGLPPDFGQPGQHYLLPDRHPEALSSAIEELLADGEHCQRMAMNGRKWVEETMSLESVLDRYATLYHELACHSK